MHETTSLLLTTDTLTAASVASCEGWSRLVAVYTVQANVRQPSAGICGGRDGGARGQGAAAGTEPAGGCPGAGGTAQAGELQATSSFCTKVSDRCIMLTGSDGGFYGSIPHWQVVAREKASNEAKSEFMSLMCHEVRTPLNGCLASAEMLLETVLQVPLHQLLSQCQPSRWQHLLICNVCGTALMSLVRGAAIRLS